MEYSIKIDPVTNWGCVSITGEVHLDVFLKAVTAAWEHPQYSKSRFGIWDFSEARTTLHFDHVLDLTDFVAKSKNGRGPNTLAIVAPEDVEFGIGRIFAAFDEKCGFNVNVFRSVAAAREWLHAQETAN